MGYLSFLLFVFIAVANAEVQEEELKCNFRICGAELLSFEKFSLAKLLRKLEYSSFCIKNCTPPVVHEFFQSIIYAISKRVPGHCKGIECEEKNRFVALAKCIHEKAWPLLQCSKRLVDLAQIILVNYPENQKINYTCSIAMETTQCMEEILQECGPKPFSLVKEMAGDVIKLGLNAYCHRSPRNDFFHDKITQPTVPYADRVKYFTDIPPRPGPRPYPQFVKGYRTNAATNSPTWSTIGILLCILLSRIVSFRFYI